MSPETEASLRAALATLFSDFETYAHKHLFPGLDRCMGHNDFVDKAIVAAKTDIGKLLLSLKGAQTAPAKSRNRANTIRDTLGADLPPNPDSLDGRSNPPKSHWQVEAEHLLFDRFGGDLLEHRNFIRQALGRRNVREHRLNTYDWQRVYSALCEDPQ